MCSMKGKEILFSIIDMYKDMPYLWKKDHSEYLKKDVREEGFKVLLETYKKIDAKATIKTVKKKIENMRTNYLRELNKVLTSKYTGADEVYVPSLWYFNSLSFLGNRTLCPTDSLENENLSSDDENLSVGSSYTVEKRKEKDCFLLETEKNHEQWEVYGRSIGYQIKDLNNNQLMVCQKIISDAIFCAKFNKLNENSHIVSPSNESTLQRDFESPPSAYPTELPERSIQEVVLNPYKVPVEFGCGDLIIPQERVSTQGEGVLDPMFFFPPVIIDGSPASLTQSRNMIARIYRFLRAESEYTKTLTEPHCDLSHLLDTTRRTADAAGVSIETVQRILEEEKGMASTSSEFTFPMETIKKKDEPSENNDEDPEDETGSTIIIKEEIDEDIVKEEVDPIEQLAVKRRQDEEMACSSKKMRMEVAPQNFLIPPEVIAQPHPRDTTKVDKEVEAKEGCLLPEFFMSKMLKNQNEIICILKNQVLLQDPDPELLTFLRFVGAKLQRLPGKEREKLQDKITDILV